MVSAMVREIELRKNYLDTDCVDTVYFGGGTPSVLEPGQMQQIFEAIERHFTLSENVEYTIETNPDDLSPAYLNWLAQSPVNRLSIGVQSFSDTDLSWMNRAHDSKRALECIRSARASGFDNLNIDLIYGLPHQSTDHWKTQLDRFMELKIPHLSAYCLTVEDKTALAYDVGKGRVAMPDDDTTAAQFEYLMQYLESVGYRHYEISNFCLPGYISKHNSAYWNGIQYLGIGPSAHSYDGKNRSWNVKSNMKYIKSVAKDVLPLDGEKLTLSQRFNERLLTGLRTDTGICPDDMEKEFGKDRISQLNGAAVPFVSSGQLEVLTNHATRKRILRLTKSGKLLADHIISSLFFT